MKPQLLCTFTYVDKLPISIGEIYKAYGVDEVINIRCYNYTRSPNNVICIYNVSIRERRLQNTVSINRKRETNTFYSINALNNLICALNNGVLDKTFTIDWSNYKDTLLLSEGHSEYKLIEIQELSF